MPCRRLVALLAAWLCTGAGSVAVAHLRGADIQAASEHFFAAALTTHDTADGRFHSEPAVLKCTWFGDDERGWFAVQLEVTVSRRVYVVREYSNNVERDPTECYLPEPEMQRFADEVASIDRARGTPIRRDLVVVSRWFDGRWTTDSFDRHHVPAELAECLDIARRCEGYGEGTAPF